MTAAPQHQVFEVAIIVDGKAARCIISSRKFFLAATSLIADTLLESSSSPSPQKTVSNGEDETCTPSKAQKNEFLRNATFLRPPRFPKDIIVAVEMLNDGGATKEQWHSQSKADSSGPKYSPKLLLAVQHDKRIHVFLSLTLARTIPIKPGFGQLISQNSFDLRIEKHSKANCLHFSSSPERGVQRQRLHIGVRDINVDRLNITMFSSSFFQKGTIELPPNGASHHKRRERRRAEPCENGTKQMAPPPNKLSPQVAMSLDARQEIIRFPKSSGIDTQTNNISVYSPIPVATSSETQFQSQSSQSQFSSSPSQPSSSSSQYCSSQSQTLPQSSPFQYTLITASIPCWAIRSVYTWLELATAQDPDQQM